MSGLTGHWGFGVENNPIIDSPWCQQFDVGVGTPPPSGDHFLLLDNTPMTLLAGGDFELL